MTENRNPKDFHHRRLLILLVSICLFLLFVSSFSASFNNGVRGALNAVLMPMQKGMNKAGSSVFTELQKLQELHYVQEENEILLREIAEMEQENTRLRLELLELEQARELLKLQEQYPQYETVGAHIIGKNSGNWYQSFLIDKGTADGIRLNMNILAMGGLVGVVTAIGPDYATVSSIINEDRYVSAMSVRTGDTFMVKGDLTLYADQKLAMENIKKNAEVDTGDIIVTSNISDIYLPGLLIGYAEEVQTDPDKLTKSGTLLPVVDFESLDNVLVILKTKETGD